MASNPWDRRTLNPKKPEDRPEGLFTAVGTALTRWEEIESELVLLLGRMTKVGIELAYVIHGNLPTMNAKTNMLVEIGKYVFKDRKEHIEYLKKLMDIVSKVVDRRNDIAHGVVGGNSSGGYLLRSPQHSKRGFDFDSWRGKYIYDKSDIYHYVQLFSFLEREVHESSVLLFGTVVSGTYSQTPFSRYLGQYKTALQTMKTHQAP